MFATYRFARRKYREHQAAKLAATTDPSSAQPSPDPTINNTVAPPPPTPQEKAAQRRRRIYRLKIVLGLSAPFLLQALDTTIVAAALPTIATAFNAQSQQNWIITVFNLTAAAFLPFWAQAADIFGRHTTLQLTLALVLAGSAICTGAPTLPALLVGRGLQGVGAAGVNICVRTVLADRVSLREYAANWALFALIAAGGYTVGPVAGGYLTAGSSWRWCFAINLPVAVGAMVVVALVLRKELLGPQPLPELGPSSSDAGGGGGRRARRLVVRLSTIDYVGQLLFLFGVGLFILALTWAGNGELGTYRWDSAKVIAPLVVGVVLTVVWFVYERSMAPGGMMARVFPHQRPMMPWVLLQEKDISILFLVNFCYGMCMYSVLYFMSYYFQYVQGKSVSDAGTGLLYFLPGLGAGALGANWTIRLWPRQTIFPLVLGSLSSAVGIQMLAWAIDVGNVDAIYGMMALAGFGVGIRMSPSSMHGLAYFPANTAQITCVFAFALPFGGAIGLTIMSTVFNNKLGASDANAKDAIKYAYYAIAPFMWLCVIAVLFLGNVWVADSGDHEVADGAYLLSLVTGKRLARETRHRGEDLTAEGRKESRTVEVV